MDLLAYWRWDAYEKDTRYGRQFACHFNSNKARLHSALRPGANLWIVGGRPGNRGVEYVLLAKLPVTELKLNAPGYEYGAYRAVGDPKSSQYFDPNGPDVTDQLMKMHFSPYKPLSVKEKKDVSMALRSLRSLTRGDAELLDKFSSRLRVMNNST